MTVLQVPAGEEGGPGGLPNLLKEEEKEEEEAEDSGPQFCSASASADRVASGPPAKRVVAKEARIGLGTWVEDAKPLPIKNPVAELTPAIATAIYIMAIDALGVPDMDTFIDASLFLKQRHKQSNEIGTEVADRLSEEAEAAGLTTSSPLHKKAKTEIETTLGQKIFVPGTVDGPPVIATGRPCLTGVPVD